MKIWLLIFSFLIFGEIGRGQELFPMIPVYKSSGFRKTFVGVKVPYADIKTNEGLKQAHRQLQSLGLTTYPALDHIFIRQKDGGVLGTVRQYSQIGYSNSTCAGICISFGGGKDENILYVGEDYTYGFKVDLNGFKSGDIRNQEGLWVTAPLSKILNEGGFLLNGDSAMDIALQTARYGNFLLKSQDRDKDSLDWPRGKFLILDEMRRGSLPISLASELIPMGTPFHEVNKLVQETKKELQTELRWQATLKQINDLAPVWKNLPAQDLVQKFCNLLRDFHDAPKELGPRCAIFASLTPHAFAYPGGDIFVTTGLMGVLPNADTLLFFLAHEYAHVIARHTTKKMKRDDFAAKFYGTLSLLSNIAVWGGTSNVIELAKTMGVSKVTMVGVKTSTEALLTIHDREDEEEADRLGFKMAMALGASSEKIISGLGTLTKYCDDTFAKNQQSAINRFMTADHAEIRDRIQKIKSMAETASLNTSGSQRPFWEKIAIQYASIYKQISLLSNYYRLQIRGADFTDKW